MKIGVYALLLVVGLLVVAGCANAVRYVDYYNACKADSACLAQMQLVNATTSVAVAKALDSSAVAGGIANMIGAAVGMIASLIAGVLYGKKVRK
ncbi:MAG: hypothetical protein [Arizlama microvirus]|nr:MAG: hypothetical protein [Arizlama microvirus]